MITRLLNALSRFALRLLWRGERLWTVRDHNERTGKQQ